MSHAEIARRAKSEIAKTLSEQLDRLKVLFALHSVNLADPDVRALYDLILKMSTVQSWFTQ